jgi:hypothetical protein
LVALVASQVQAVPAPVAQSLNNKVLFGYQGWFVSSTDGAGLHWNHWSSNGQTPAPSPSPTNTGLAFDLYPDVSEYPKLYDTNLNFSNGSKARLFSAYDLETVDLHFKWMQKYNLDGVFVQRFVSELTDPTLLADRNKVLANVKASAEKYQRTFSVMYDTSGANNATFDTTIQKDWQWIKDQGYLDSPYYQYHNSRPVVTIWGFGFQGRNIQQTPALNLIKWLRAFPSTPMGGVPYYWRTGDHDSDPGWNDVYSAFEILSPWAVGRYSDQNSFTNLLNTVEIPDMQYIKQQGWNTDYAPVIWPGFSWANLQNTPSDYNAIPRQGGSFYCFQANGVLGIKPLFVYVAMFDEVNESTAILKAASAKTDTPVGATFLYLNVDGQNLPSDHYLTLSGGINHAMRSRMCENKQCTASMACNALLDEESFRNTVINRTFNVY